MNKTAIKNFSIWARNKLIADVKYRAGLMGITEDGIAEKLPQSTNTTEFFDIGTAEPYALNAVEIKQRKKLVEALAAKTKDTDYKTAYKYILEEVAYTWFNRLIAVRFMEVNDYLPSHVKVLSSDAGKQEPDLVTNPFDSDIEFSDSEKEMIVTFKQDNKLDALFRFLFIKQCNALNEILPALFEKTSDYTELLLNISFIDQDGVVAHLVNDIEAEDFDVSKGGQVEIIGWLYQYYNTEPKNEAFAKDGKITKEEIPAVTQLFTPDWIVRYMVENSLGRIWYEGHKNEDLKGTWKYYLDEADQEPDVQTELNKIYEEHAKLNPEDIKVIDPCMGSGHILVYAFDVLMQIYESAGYTQRDAAKLILEKNIYGLDIDDRAFQMAYFAIMMKARQYNRRILSKETAYNLCSIQESNGFDCRALDKLGELKKDGEYLIDVFHDAKEYGSILNVDISLERLEALERKIDELKNVDSMGNLFDMIYVENLDNGFRRLINQAKNFVHKYEIVITNPPYFVVSNGSVKVYDYVVANYPSGKSDMYGVFIEKCNQMLRSGCYQAMITQHTWMFIAAFSNLRRYMTSSSLVNMNHLGARAFDEIAGEVVQTTSFVYRKLNVEHYKGMYCRITKPTSEKSKEELYLSGSMRYVSSRERFDSIPDSPMAYWASDKLIASYSNPLISAKMDCRSGIMTGSDNYIRIWQEPSICNIKFDCSSEADMGDYKWFPINSGGEFRKWYGNNNKVVNLWHGGKQIKDNVKNYRLRDPEFYFKEGLTWGRITTTQIAFRNVVRGSLFGDAGPVGFIKEGKEYVLGFLCSKVVNELLQITNPTMNFQVHDIMDLPLLVEESKIELVEETVRNNLVLSQRDWDTYELSWDYASHPLTKGTTMGRLISDKYKEWEEECNNRFNQLKANEEELNRIFIDIYGLQDELTPEVEDKDVTVRKAELQRDIKSLLSYAVGCMFGRYSLDVEGLAYAGGEWDSSKYVTFIPDADNVIPITDEEYLEDDIVARLCEFLKVVYGADTLEANLDFIAQALGNKGNSCREVIRNYFVSEFFADHCSTYSVTGSGKRPIYWLFDSGKQNGFKALVYLHRYTPDTIGNLRVDYLHRMQRVYEAEIDRMQDTIDHSANSREVGNATRRKEKLVKQLKECRDYDEKIGHLALARTELDLDDGVKYNYKKLQLGSDGVFYEVLADSKSIMMDDKKFKEFKK